MSKKVMSLILFDGTAEGPQKYSIGNKKIVGYKISREFITDEMDSSFYDELHSQGVYVLIGNRNNGKGENIYIGQSDNIAKRLNDHKGGKDGEKAVYNARVLEELCKMAAITRMIRQDTDRLPAELIRKHYERKHGKNAYYGQK